MTRARIESVVSLQVLQSTAHLHAWLRHAGSVFNVGGLRFPGAAEDGFEEHLHLNAGRLLLPGALEHGTPLSVISCDHCARDGHQWSWSKKTSL